MNNGRQSNGKLLLLFIAAILILCAGFFIVSCGKPQQKTDDSNAGSYGVDFSRCPASDTSCIFLAEKDEIPEVSDRELTIEAWVKRKTDDVNGSIFSRLDTSRGVSLYIKNNEPKFAIRVMTSATSTEDAPTPTADYILGSGDPFKLAINAWTHIAGIVSNAAHSHFPTTTSCSETVMEETPHMDIYVNGAFANCATTWGDSSDPATGPQFPDNPGHHQLTVGSQSLSIDDISGTSNAVIDEVRLWGTAREAADILACMNTELGIGGTCDRGDSNLAAYYRMNEGKGSDVTDLSGNGLSGSLLMFIQVDEFTTLEEHWLDGWVTGNPNLQGAD